MVPERDAVGLEIWSILQGGSPSEIVERDDGMISALRVFMTTFRITRTEEAAEARLLSDFGPRQMAELQNDYPGCPPLGTSSPRSVRIAEAVRIPRRAG